LEVFSHGWVLAHFFVFTRWDIEGESFTVGDEFYEEAGG